MYDRYLAETGERVRVSHIANLPECASRIMRKVRVAGGIWKFISLDRIGSLYVWTSGSAIISSNGGTVTSVAARTLARHPVRHLRRSAVRRTSSSARC